MSDIKAARWMAKQHLYVSYWMQSEYLRRYAREQYEYATQLPRMRGGRWCFFYWQDGKKIWFDWPKHTMVRAM